MLFRSRLAPTEMYPAHAQRLAARAVRLRSGLRVRVVEAGAAAGEPVLLIHGWGASVYGWRYVQPALAAAGYRTVAFDLKGHGLSDKPLDEGEYTLAAMHAHVLEVMAALRLPRAVVVGHSMGGRLAIELALAAPERVRALALLAPAGIGVVRGTRLARLPLHTLAPVSPALIRRPMIAAMLRACYGRLGAFTDSDVDEYWAPSQFAANGRAAVMLARHFAWAPVDVGQLAALGVPLLVVRGTVDRIVRLQDHAALARRLPAGALLVVEGAGHLPHEEAPAQVVPALLALAAA